MLPSSSTRTSGPASATPAATPSFTSNFASGRTCSSSAPLDANTLAKLAVGLCDNCLTCVWRAWDVARPVVLAPAMNTLMWQHPFTRRHLRTIAADAGAGHIPAHLADDALINQINDRSPTLRVVSPVNKALACGDTGIGGLADVADIVAAVQTMIARAQAA